VFEDTESYQSFDERKEAVAHKENDDPGLRNTKPESITGNIK
jgi:hypothetical protein